MTDSDRHRLSLTNAIGMCDNALRGERMAEAIRYAYDAATAADNLAQALERQRVERDKAKRAENAAR